MAKRPDRLGYWSHIMQEQASSGLSIKAFCAKRKISLYQFYSWRRRLRDANQAAPEASGFIELQPVSPEDKGTIRIHIRHQVWIEVEKGFHPPTLLSVVETLRHKMT